MTWASVTEGISKALSPDCAQPVMIGNLVVLGLIALIYTVILWSLAAKGHCGQTFQNVRLCAPSPFPPPREYMLRCWGERSAGLLCSQ